MRPSSPTRRRRPRFYAPSGRLAPGGLPGRFSGAGFEVLRLGRGTDRMRLVITAGPPDIWVGLEPETGEEASWPVTSRTITGRALTSRSTKMHPTDGRLRRRKSARSSRSPKSVACIIATSGGRHNSTSPDQPTATTPCSRHQPSYGAMRLSTWCCGRPEGAEVSSETPLRSFPGCRRVYRKIVGDRDASRIGLWRRTSHLRDHQAIGRTPGWPTPGIRTAPFMVESLSVGRLVYFRFGTSSKRASWARWSESLKPSTGSRSVRSTQTGVISTSLRAE
jgi:hypothetical protein